MAELKSDFQFTLVLVRIRLSCSFTNRNCIAVKSCCITVHSVLPIPHI